MQQSRTENIPAAVNEAGLAMVAIDRPAKRNALTLAMWRRLGEVFEEAGRSPQVRAVLLTGGGSHFSAGADIAEFPTVRATPEQGRVYEAAVEGALKSIRDCPKPTIAAVNGYALGGGCGIALACDLRIGDATTRMGIPAAKLGNVYGVVECELLLRQVGLANAKLVLYSGRQFTIEECIAMRLVDIRAEGDVMQAAGRVCDELTANAPISLEGAKTVLELLERGEAEKRHNEIDAVIAKALGSEDYREAAKAFVEKRKPVFRGR